MHIQKLALQIEQIWDKKEELRKNVVFKKEVSILLKKVLELLNKGTIRTAEKINGNWHTNEWIKRAILLSFLVSDSKVFKDNVCNYYDKVGLKCFDWSKEAFESNGFRAVPGSMVRQGSFIGKGVVIMPSFINIGCFIDVLTMIDIYACIGSCAQVGKKCHISAGVVIGGVLEPINASPVIVEDNCFIGANSSVVEGVIVEEGSVISMGVHLGASTKIVDRETGEVMYGRVPAGSVVVAGFVKDSDDISISAAIIVKKVNRKTLDKVAHNEILR